MAKNEELIDGSNISGATTTDAGVVMLASPEDIESGLVGKVITAKDFAEKIAAVSDEVTALRGEAVLLAGEQTVTGKKTFSAIPVVTGVQETNLVDYVSTDDVVKVSTLKNKIVYTDPSDNGATAAVGGVAKGKKYENTDIMTVIHDILHPFVAPSGVGLTLSPTNGGVFEKGTQASVASGTVRWTNGSTLVNKVELLKGGSPVATESLEGSATNKAITYADTITADTAFSGRITETGGKTYTSGNVNFTFVYPYFYGVLDAGTELNGEAILGLTKDVKTKGTKSYTFDTGNVEKKIVMAYPKSYGNLRSILDPNNFENIDKFGSPTVVSVTGTDSTPQEYNVYSANMNVAAFTLKFSY